LALVCEINCESSLTGSDGFDSVVTDGGRLSWSSSAGLGGSSGGVSVQADDTVTIYGRKDWTQITSDEYRFRFYFDPNGYAEYGIGQILAIYDNNSGRLQVSYTSSSGPDHSVRVRYMDDSMGWTYLGSSVSISDAEHYIEIHVEYASGASANDGQITYYIDGVQQQQVSNIDLYNLSKPSSVRLGVPYTGNDWNSTFYLDEFIFRDDGTEIGESSQEFDQSAAGSISPSGGLAREIGLGGQAGTLAPAGQLSYALQARRTVAGILAPAGQLVRLTDKQTQGTLVPAGSLARGTAKTAGGVLVPAGVLARLPGKLAQGTVSPSGAATRSVSVTRSGALAPAGDLVRQAGKALAGLLAPSGTSARLPRKSTAGTVSAAGAVTRRSSTHSPAGTLGLAGAMTRTTRLTGLAGDLALAGSIALVVRVVLTGQLSASGAVATVTAWTLALAGVLGLTGAAAKLVSLSGLSGSLAPAGGLTTFKKIIQLATGGLGLAGSSTRQTSTSTDGSLAMAGQLTRLTQLASLSGTLVLAGVATGIRLYFAQLTGVLSPAGSLARHTSTSTAGSLAPSGIMTRLVVLVAFAGDLGLAGSVSRAARLTLAGTVAMAGSLARAVSISLGGVLVSAGQLTRITRLVLAGSLSPAGGLFRFIALVAFTGDLVPAGQLTRSTRTAAAGELGPAGQLARSTGKALAGSLGLAGLGDGRKLGIPVLVTGTLVLAGTVAKKAQLDLAGSLLLAGGLARFIQLVLSRALGLAGTLVPLRWEQAGPVIRAAVQGIRLRAGRVLVPPTIRGARTGDPDIKGTDET